MGHEAPAALGVYKPRRPQASPLFRLVSEHVHRLQTVYDERFAGLLTRQDADFIEKNVYDESPASAKLKRGDVLLASTGDGTLGKCCVYDLDLPAIADGHVTIIRVDPKEIDPYFLCDYLRCGFGAEQIARLYTGSTGLIELTPEDAKRVLVILPGDVGAQKALSAKVRSEEAKFVKSLGGAEEQLKHAREEFQAATGV